MEDARISHSRASVRVALPLAILWIALGLFLKSWAVVAAAALVGLGFTSGMILHRMNAHTLARITWFLIANVGAFWATFLVHPMGYISFMFAPACAMPFLMFSLGRDRNTVISLVCVPITFWFVGWYTDYSLYDSFVIGEEQARTIIAPLSAMTVFILVMIEMSYFASVFSSYSRGLAVARRRAVVSSEAKSAFLRSMSHELKTPLNAIIGFSDLTQQDAEHGREISPKALAERMEMVGQAGGQIADMVENMLAFASLTNEASEDELQPVDTTQIISIQIAKLLPKAEAKDLDVSCDFDRTQKVLADPERLGEVVKQLLTNGIKFAPEGGWVHVTAHQVDEKCLRLMFIDSGPGFDENDVVRAFRPFERLSAENGTISGAGVGLAIVRTHVRAMHGRVGIEKDAYGKYAVWIELPIAHEKAS